MKGVIVGLVSGVIFSFGLVFSGMTNPSKVIGFLDIFGNWDPSLAFVMGGAVCFNLVSFRFILKRDNPLLGKKFDLPSKRDIDKNLLTGASIFGVGWGLIGICPGPSIVNIVTLHLNSFLFIGSMIAGMAVFKILNSSS